MNVTRSGVTGRRRSRYDIRRTAGAGEDMVVNNEAYVYLPPDPVTNHAQQVEREEDKRNHPYQEIGITDYEHMYSKARQFSTSGKCDPSPQEKKKERDYAELSITTLDSASVYTKTSLKHH